MSAEHPQNSLLANVSSHGENEKNNSVQTSSPFAIEAKLLSRVFKTRTRNAGVMSALKAFVKPVYTEKVAVKELNLQIPHGHVVGLVGANGAGKTTLMKMMAGLLHPTGGSIEVLGHTPHKRERSFLKRVGMVMGQKSQMWVDIPASDTYALLAAIYEIPDEVYKPRIKTLSEQFKVDHVMGTQVRRLSLGERMKLEIIAALLHEPELLILDEPTIGLDVMAKDTIRDFIRTHNKERSTTILLSSHDLEDISELCQDLLVVHKGELVFNDALNNFSKDISIKRRVQEILSQ
jgi:ABC-2 type transport system ATP-binding protein